MKKMMTQINKFMVHSKGSIDRKVYSNMGLYQETRKVKINNLNLKLKELEKEE